MPQLKERGFQILFNGNRTVTLTEASQNNCWNISYQKWGLDCKGYSTTHISLSDVFEFLIQINVALV